MKKILTALTMCVLAIGADAQEAKVKSFAADLTDLTAAKYSRLDNNGVKCAVVKVRVIADDVKFKGSVINPVTEEPAEYWVYMPQHEKRLQILSRSFLPMMVEFPEPLTAGVTYILTLEAPQFAVPAQTQAVAEPQGEALLTVIDGEESKFEKFLENGKWGFKYNDEVAIPAKYGEVKRFTEGLAPVKLTVNWGFIDKNGALVIPLKYNSVSNFSEGLAAVELDGKWGYIDKEGEVVIPFEYSRACDFHEGMAKIDSGHNGWHFIDKKGNDILHLGPFIWGGADYDGQGEYVNDFSEGLAAARKDNKWGFIDKKGNTMIPYRYDDAGSFKNGKAEVRIGNVWFKIDKEGNEVE